MSIKPIWDWQVASWYFKFQLKNCFLLLRKLKFENCLKCSAHHVSHFQLVKILLRQTRKMLDISNISLKFKEIASTRQVEVISKRNCKWHEEWKWELTLHFYSDHQSLSNPICSGWRSGNAAASSAGAAEQVHPRAVQDQELERVPAADEPEAAGPAAAVGQEDAQNVGQVSFWLTPIMLLESCCDYLNERRLRTSLGSDVK